MEGPYRSSETHVSARDSHTWDLQDPRGWSQEQTILGIHDKGRRVQSSQWSSRSENTCVSLTQGHNLPTASSKMSLPSSRSSITIADTASFISHILPHKSHNSNIELKPTKTNCARNRRATLRSFAHSSLRNLARQLFPQQVTKSTGQSSTAAESSCDFSNRQLDNTAASAHIDLPHTLPQDSFDWSGRGPHITVEPGQNLPIRHCCFGSQDTYDVVMCSGIELVRRIYLPRSQSNVSLSMLRKDAIGLAKLRHTHIAQVVGSYQTTAVIALLSYPVADMDLGYYLQQSSTSILESKQRCTDLPFGNTSSLWSHDVKAFLSDISLCMLSTIRYVHCQELIHGNLKTSNFLLRLVTPSPWTQSKSFYPPFKIYLTDFALGALHDAAPYYPNGYKHTYTPPEILQGDALTPMADIFSLGCVFAEMSVVCANLRLPLVSPSTKRLSASYPNHPEAYAAHLPGIYSLLSSLDTDTEMVVNNQMIRRMLDPNPPCRPRLYHSQEATGDVLELDCEHYLDGPDELESFVD